MAIDNPFISNEKLLYPQSIFSKITFIEKFNGTSINNKKLLNPQSIFSKITYEIDLVINKEKVKITSRYSKHYAFLFYHKNLLQVPLAFFLVSAFSLWSSAQSSFSQSSDGMVIPVGRKLLQFEVRVLHSA